ncbi:hypothetical protein TARUN_8924 [Trichoderma arundinaceum]|uniref:Uncharacterized protein n=1 Tax=Trichoderma arundinaceum TaxID=490622 RepID=A0A395NB53_TRIAR|nr:hypothetical protein TARUN_8924 [Trichoderma arundinaceum]
MMLDAPAAVDVSALAVALGSALTGSAQVRTAAIASARRLPLAAARFLLAPCSAEQLRFNGCRSLEFDATADSDADAACRFEASGANANANSRPNANANANANAGAGATVRKKTCTQTTARQREARMSQSRQVPRSETCVKCVLHPRPGPRSFVGQWVEAAMIRCCRFEFGLPLGAETGFDSVVGLEYAPGAGCCSIASFISRPCRSCPLSFVALDYSELLRFAAAFRYCWPLLLANGRACLFRNSAACGGAAAASQADSGSLSMRIGQIPTRWQPREQQASKCKQPLPSSRAYCAPLLKNPFLPIAHAPSGWPLRNWETRKSPPVADGGSAAPLLDWLSGVAAAHLHTTTWGRGTRGSHRRSPCSLALSLAHRKMPHMPRRRTPTPLPPMAGRKRKDGRGSGAQDSVRVARDTIWLDTRGGGGTRIKEGIQSTDVYTKGSSYPPLSTVPRFLFFHPCTNNQQPQEIPESASASHSKQSNPSQPPERVTSAATNYLFNSLLLSALLLQGLSVSQPPIPLRTARTFTRRNTDTMCTTNVYTYVYSDGHKEQSRQPVLCSASRHGKVCSNNVVFQHPSQFIQHVDTPLGASPSSPFVSQFPPTPTYSPRSGTPNYRSGDESDRSRRSTSSSRRRSASVYINGQKVIDLNRHDGGSRRERIVLVEGPPTPRTPPTAFNFPSTAPPSPNVSANASASPSVYGSSPRGSDSSFSRRPVIVDDRTRVERVERPRIQIEVVEAAPSLRTPKHDRQSSTSSRDSHGRSSADEEEALRRRREREERRVEKQREEEEERQRRIRLRIAKANAEINKRPPVPMPPAPIRASSFKSTAAVVNGDDDVKKLADGVRRMSFEEERREEKARHLARKQEQRDEEEAQRQRLAERMMPRRRATVGPGSRRHRVVYDDGVYRWE